MFGFSNKMLKFLFPPRQSRNEINFALLARLNENSGALRGKGIKDFNDLKDPKDFKDFKDFKVSNHSERSEEPIFGSSLRSE